MLKSVCYPTVAAYAPGPKFLKKWPSMKANWLVPCPWCHSIHLHGVGEGRREEHCPSGAVWRTAGWDRPNGYTLKFAGVLDDPKIFAEESRRTKKLYDLYVDFFKDRGRARRKSPLDPLPLWEPAFATLAKQMRQAWRGAAVRSEASRQTPYAEAVEQTRPIGLSAY